MTVPELQERAAALEIAGWRGMTRAELVDAIASRSPSDAEAPSGGSDGGDEPEAERMRVVSRRDRAYGTPEETVEAENAVAAVHWSADAWHGGPAAAGGDRPW
jgi:hypothetical protein